MPSVFIIHGIYGSPKENWFPWIKKELEELACDVYVPHFPTSNPTLLGEWLGVFKPYQKYLDKASIVIGHSVGVPFILTILESSPAKSAFLVSGFATNPDNEFTPIMKNIADKQFDWSAIRKNCKNFTVFHSDNDPYVPLSLAEELAENLGTEVSLVEGAGHFNADAGYTAFPLLLEYIKQCIDIA
jgi:uncharacterized protein